MPSAGLAFEQVLRSISDRQLLSKKRKDALLIGTRSTQANTTDDTYYGEGCRVTRGGGWFDKEPHATTFNRERGVPDPSSSDELGFRCTRSK